MGKTKIRSFGFLNKIFDNIPTEVVYIISKYCGNYINLPKLDINVYKTKTRQTKYFTKHLISNNRHRAFSI